MDMGEDMEEALAVSPTLLLILVVATLLGFGVAVLGRVILLPVDDSHSAGLSKGRESYIQMLSAIRDPLWNSI
jgi:hypothetical protein